jgi:hypothetical protein
MKTFLLLFSALFFSFPVSSQSDKSKSKDRELRSDTIVLQKSPETAIDTINPREYYPGSKRYYAKRPLNKRYSYYDSFVKEPDNSAKYYLIIKDPLTKKVTR